MLPGEDCTAHDEVYEFEKGDKDGKGDGNLVFLCGRRLLVPLAVPLLPVKDAATILCQEPFR